MRLMGVADMPAIFRPQSDRESPLQTRKLSGNAPAAGLFGDQDVPVVLAGTSYSLRGNFHGFLQEALSVEVLNVARDGGGFLQSIRDYLKDDAFVSSKPQVLIWELPERFLSLDLPADRDMMQEIDHAQQRN
jgi:alginate O-acetyltransferase complex protein AlgJ